MSSFKCRSKPDLCIICNKLAQRKKPVRLLLLALQSSAKKCFPRLSLTCSPIALKTHTRQGLNKPQTNTHWTNPNITLQTDTTDHELSQLRPHRPQPSETNRYLKEPSRAMLDRIRTSPGHAGGRRHRSLKASPSSSPTTPPSRSAQVKRVRGEVKKSTGTHDRFL